MDLNNSFPNYPINQMNERMFFNIDSNTYCDQKINSSFHKINNLKLFDKEINKVNFNLSPSLNKKRSSLDISYSIEQTFYENSNMNIDDEFQNEETCKIKCLIIYKEIYICLKSFLVFCFFNFK